MMMMMGRDTSARGATEAMDSSRPEEPKSCRRTTSSVIPSVVRLTEACVELRRSEEAVALPVQTLKHFLQLLGGQRQLLL